MAAPFFFYFSLSFSFFFAHVSKCFSIKTGANNFSQNSHGTAFKTYYFSYFYPYYSSFPSSSFLIPLIAALKFSDVALQLSLVLSNPFVFPNCFYFFLFSLINAACIIKYYYLLLRSQPFCFRVKLFSFGHENYFTSLCVLL